MQYQNVKATYVGAFVVYLFWIACVFDPVGEFYGLKFISIALIFTYLSLRFLIDGLPRSVDYSYFFVFILFIIILPLYGLAVSAFRGGLGTSQFIDTSYISAAVYMICALLYVIPDYCKVACNALVWSMRLLCLVIWVGFVLLSFKIESDFLFFFVDNGAAYIGSRNYAGVDFYYIYFVASPMLVFMLCKECWEFFERKTIYRFVGVFIVVGALFLSGTRASIIMSLVAPLIVWLWRKYGAKSLLLWLCVAMFFIPVLGLLELPVISEMFSLNEASNSEKIGYLSTYSDLFAQPITFLFGQGFNAHVWSHAVANMLPEGASKTELTYFEMIRVFGIIGFLLFIYALFLLCASNRMMKSNYPWAGPSLFLYALMSSINPYIFSSNGMLVLGFSASAYLHLRKSIDSNSLRVNSI